MERMKSVMAPFSLAAVVLTVGLVPSAATAQCTPGWLAGGANSNMNGLIRGLHTWDPDGDGPQPVQLVAVGDFFGANSAGTASANRIAAWDGENWSAFGDGIDAGVYSVTSLSATNNLYVAGAGFTMAGGVSARRIAQWDGSAWSGLGTGEGNTPPLALLSVTAMNADTIVIVGAFTGVADVPANRIAAWNESLGWHALGDGMSSTTACTTVMPNGDLIAGGAALTTGGKKPVTLNRIGRWDGSQWHPLADGLSGLVRCLLVTPNGDLIVGGAFTHAGDVEVNRIARWDGAEWHPLGAGMDADVYALAVAPDGTLIATGDFLNAGGNEVNRIATWDGTEWSSLGAGRSDGGRALAVLPNGELAVGGNFLMAGDQPSAYFARYVLPCGGDDCRADFNSDDAVNSQDFFDFVTAFFALTPNADFNTDGEVNSQDFFDFLTAFFAGC